MSHDSEETSTCAGIWVTLNYFACSWGWTVIVWESLLVAYGELGWLSKCARASLPHATAALKPETSCFKFLAGIQGLSLWLCEQKQKIKDKLCITGCYVAKQDPGEGLKGLRPLKVALWEMGEGRDWDNASWSALSLLGRADNFSMSLEGSWLPWASPLHCLSASKSWFLRRQWCSAPAQRRNSQP